MYNGCELRNAADNERTGIISYLGHDPELFDDSIKNNILLGDNKDVNEYLKAVCIDKEVEAMEQGADTIIGSGGVRLSGGQAQRIALARTLCHKKPVLILDDPFSALDKNTEEQIYNNLRKMTEGSIVIILSHRLYMFPKLDKVIWLDEGSVRVGTHDELMLECMAYRQLNDAANAMSEDTVSYEQRKNVKGVVDKHE